MPFYNITVVRKVNFFSMNWKTLSGLNAVIFEQVLEHFNTRMEIHRYARGGQSNDISFHI